MAASTEMMAALHSALAEVLLDSIREKDCPASVLAVAAKFLKDNDITSVIEDNDAMRELDEKLKERAARRSKLSASEVDELTRMH